MHSSHTSGGQRLGVLAAGLVLLTGCGAGQSEQQLQEPPQPPPPPPAPTTSAPPEPPPRPFEIRLDGVDPCELLSAEQRAQLGFDRDPTPDSEAGFGNAATCSYRNTSGKVGARLALVTTEGMGVWTDDTAQVEATPKTINGFPALVIKTPGLDLSCNVAVDVAEGQHLDVLYRDDGGQPPPPVDQLCAGAERVAEEVLKTMTAPETSSEVPETSSSTPTAEW